MIFDVSERLAFQKINDVIAYAISERKDAIFQGHNYKQMSGYGYLRSPAMLRMGKKANGKEIRFSNYRRGVLQYCPMNNGDFPFEQQGGTDWCLESITFSR